jgi:hypothetical protein
LITLQWFLCLFVNTLPTETVLRVWDMFFNEGDKVLFRIAIGLLKMHEAKLLSAREESGELFTTMRELGREVVDADLLIATSYKREWHPICVECAHKSFAHCSALRVYSQEDAKGVNAGAGEHLIDQVGGSGR